jgi:hypothetical protein
VSVTNVDGVFTYEIHSRAVDPSMRKVIAGVGSLGVVALTVWIPAGCSAGSSSGGEGSRGALLPLVTPPVLAATPTGLGGSGTGLAHTNDHAAGLRVSSLPSGVGAALDGTAPPPTDADASSGDGGMGSGPTPSSDSGPDSSSGMCPGSGGVCPDGAPGPVPGPDGGTDAGGGMCPGSGGVCLDGAPGPSPGSEGGTGPAGSICSGGVCPEGGAAPGGRGLDPSDIRARFFSAGPTDIFSLLAEIDNRIGEINQRSRDQNVPCLSQPPVPYTLTPFGQPVPFYAQCVSHVSTPTPSNQAFFQFGQMDGVFYLYEAIGAEAIGARLTPVTGSSGQYAVDAWIGVGYDNATSCGSASGFDDCSYGVMALKADPSRMHFELTVAGIGFGYCGAQLRSDGLTVYVQGSRDMGATCAESANVCVSAGDVTMPAMCASTSFDLPSIGRSATSGPNGTWGASQNGSAGIVLDGTASDSLAFGPSTPTPGVPEFVMTPIDNEGGGSRPQGGGGVAAPPGTDAATE